MTLFSFPFFFCPEVEAVGSSEADSHALLWTVPRRVVSLFLFHVLPARRVGRHRTSSVMRAQAKRHHPRIAVTGVPEQEAQLGLADFLSEFEHRPWLRNVTAEWEGTLATADRVG